MQKFKIVLIFLLLMPIGCATVADKIIQKYDIVVVNSTENRIKDIVIEISSKLFPVVVIQSHSAYTFHDITTTPSAQIIIQWHDDSELVYKETISVPNDFIWNFNGREIVFTIMPENNVSVSYLKRQ